MFYSMAKVTITIEDAGNGRVKTVCDPSVETMMKMDTSGAGLTSAQGYALLALNTIRKESRRSDSNLLIHMPKIGL
jgi:hypothetical protein